MSPALPPLSVTIYSDYACPFCYVGDRRIRKLAEHFDLSITHRPVEIHPETPPEGMPLEDLGYPAEQWTQMMAHLDAMAKEEGLNMAPRTFTTNTHDALLLSEAAKAMGGEIGDEIFELIHEGLFHAFFSQGKNIGDPKILEEIAVGAGMDPETFANAMVNPAHEDALRQNFAAARKDGVTSVPTFVINGQVVRGAMPLGALMAVAQEVAEV